MNMRYEQYFDAFYLLVLVGLMSSRLYEMKFDYFF